MRRALAPYAISSALIVVVSLALLAGALATGGLLEDRAATEARPSPSRTPIELSRAGRLAYWRSDPSGGYQLWVASIDGANRRAIAKTAVMSSIDTVRWSPDGSALAYIDRGHASVVVIRLDGPQADLRLNASIVASDARLTGLDWSTDSRQIATTVRSATGPVTDVYVAPASGGDWRNVTSLENAFLSQWVSPSELLIHTLTGMIAVVHADGTGLAPLTGLTATSPFIADDGRVYFLAGLVAPAVRDPTVSVVNASQASVWSTTIDGADPRQEIPYLFDDVRLVTRWSDGLFVVQQGAGTALAFLVVGQPIKTIPGVIDQVVFSPDRRTAIGLNATRITRYDTAHPESPVALLTDLFQPAAWYPSPAPVAARASQTPAARPAPSARFTFALHGLLWATDARGSPQAVGRLRSDSDWLERLGGSAIPQWSPNGDRILYFDLERPWRGMAYVTDLSGAVRRLSDESPPGTPEVAVGPFPGWTPDGNVAYTAFIGTSDSVSFGAVGAVRIVTPTSTAPIATYTGREIAFGGGKTYLIDDGKLSVSGQTRTDHGVVEQTATGNRTITTAALLYAGLTGFVGAGPGPATQTRLQLSMLGASADGAFLSARINPATGTTGFAFVVFRASDGRPSIQLDRDAVSDVRWAPGGHQIGMTINRTAAWVRDAETGAMVIGGNGRFAGWSPDGKWFYVARETGLYAQALAGGEPVRVSALGVPVSATP